MRARAFAQTLFSPTSLADAMRRLGFVQADPIRAPARAQDLILRHRVDDYRAGDLERCYPSLDVDEDVVYAYGFVSSETAASLHPKTAQPVSPFERRVLAIVREHGPLHSGDLPRWFGHDRVINAWGGQSRATKVALERLHRRGSLRIARRDSGIRVYEARPLGARASLPARLRLRHLIAVVANLFAPVSERTLSAIAAYLSRHLSGKIDHRTVMRAMLADGALERDLVDGRAYLWPPGDPPAPASHCVRLLAPFDPIVWDRRRFEHLWGWEYRFEAYTPPEKRIRGYYALPLFWGDDAIGWANVRQRASDVDVELGFVRGRPRERAFAHELEREIERLRTFLRPR